MGNCGAATPGSGIAKFREQQERGTARVDGVVCVQTHTFAPDKDLTPNPGHGHPWFGNAESYFRVGDALGKAALAALDKNQ